MRKTTRLKNLVLDKRVLVMPGAYDAFSAKLIEAAGFEACQISGFGLAASLLGKPDVGLMTMSEAVEATRRIARAVDIPVMADGDTGYGNALNVYRTVQEFEDAGAAGINLEDQVWPKRCGHMSSGHRLISMEEMVEKIQAAVEARRDPDFVLNIRTDAISVYGVDEAIRRANAYAEAGATLVYVEAPRSVEEIKRIVQEVNAPVSICQAEGGKTPLLTVDEMNALGVARMSVPIAPLFAAFVGVRGVLEHLRKNGTTAGYFDRYSTPGTTIFQEVTKLLGLDRIEELEKRFVKSFQS